VRLLGGEGWGTAAGVMKNLAQAGRLAGRASFLIST